MTKPFLPVIERRADLTKRLVAALKHLSRDAAVHVVSSFIGLDKLEEIVEFQERT